MIGRFTVKYKSILLNIIFGLMAIALASLFVFKPTFGIDFTGGSIMEIGYDSPSVTINEVREKLGDSYIVQESDSGFIIKGKINGDEEKANLLEELTIDNNKPTLLKYDNIGPSIGKETKVKTINSIIAIIILLIMFIAYAFRKTPKPLRSWDYSLAAIVALIHDILLPSAIYIALGFEINTLFVVGLLSILGLSINDTIVIFDRLRDELSSAKNKNITQFKEAIAKAISASITRSINTSMTLLLALIALFIFGPESTQGLVLIMGLGTIFGTYSSIFLATTLLVSIAESRHAKSS